MKFTRLLALFFATSGALLGTFRTASAAPGAGVVEIGFLPGETQSVAYGVSNCGCYVAGSSGQRAFIWSDGFGMLPLTPLVLGGKSEAFAVTEAGTAVGYAIDEDGVKQPVWWDFTGGIHLLGNLAEGVSGEARSVSFDGTVIVGRSGKTPFIWDAVNGMRALDPSLTNGTAYGISGDGLTVVGVNNSVPFRWTAAGGVQTLPTFDFPGAAKGTAYGVSSTGTYITGVSPTGGILTEGFRLTDAYGLESVGTPQNLNRSASYAIDDQGLTAVGEADYASTGPVPFPGVSYAMVWQNPYGCAYIADILDFEGADTSDWQGFESCRGVSGTGDVVVGYGVNWEGKREAFYALIQPPSTFPLLEMTAFRFTTPTRVGGNNVTISASVPPPGPDIRPGIKPTPNKIYLQSYDTNNLILQKLHTLNDQPGIYFKDVTVTTAFNNAKTKGVAGNKDIMVRGTYGILSKFIKLRLTKATHYVPILSQSSIQGGNSTTCTVKLTGQAPPVGATATVTTSRPDIVTVPSSITYNAFDTVQTFTVGTGAVTSNQTVNIFVTYGGVARKVVLTVTP